MNFSSVDQPEGKKNPQEVAGNISLLKTKSHQFKRNMITNGSSP